jgi:hypothetical protein
MEGKALNPRLRVSIKPVPLHFERKRVAYFACSCTGDWVAVLHVGC